MKLAVVFSGQGAQKPGMGASYLKQGRFSGDIFAKTPQRVLDLCFSGTPEELAKTDVTQPCVYAVTMAGYAELCGVLAELGVAPAMFAGFSLGEYAALNAADVLDYSAGLRLVADRGVWMQQEAEKFDGGMIAAMGETAQIEALARQAAECGVLLPVNYNCPTQTVVAGVRPALERFLQLAAEAGIRAVPLRVSGAFHTPLMAAAADKIRAALDKIGPKQPKTPVYWNVTGDAVLNGTLTDTIAAQTKSPVRWEASVRAMLRDGADTFVEVGVGKTLCGLIRKIDRSVRVSHVEDMESLAKTVELLRAGV